MSSPEEVCAKIYGGKPKDWKIIDYEELQETYDIALLEINKLRKEIKDLKERIKILEE